MHVVEITIPYTSTLETFHFFPLGDIHSGAIECDEVSIKEKVQDVVKDDHSYVLGQGDYADCITKSDPRFDALNLAGWVEKTNIVESQRAWVKDLFEPLAKEKRLIALLTGNHEEEIHLRHDNDLVRNLCRDLNVAYAGYTAYIVLRFLRGVKSEVFIWHAWHGSGAAQSEGARLNRLIRLAGDIEADIYTMGHIHGAITTYTPDRLYYNKDKRKIDSKKITASLSGSWVFGYMQTEEDEEHKANPYYGEKKGYKPARIGCPVIHIRPENREVWLEV